MQFHVKLLIVLTLLCMAGAAQAKETLESILAIAAKQQNVAIDYREVRYLQMLHEPWQAQGKMIVTINAFVIEQLTPQRQLLVANKHRFWLYAQENGMRRTGMLTSTLARRSFGLFKPIIYGDRKALEKDFDIHFESTDVEWLLELKPKQMGKALYSRISVKGKNAHTAEYMKTESPDGDFTEWFFRQQQFSATTEEMLEQLMVEAKGE